MKFYIIIVLVAVLCCSFVFQTSFTPFHIKFPKTKSHIEIDGFSNIYVINDNEIVKYNSVGVLQKKFSTKRYGKIDFVDAMNPLKLLLADEHTILVCS